MHLVIVPAAANTDFARDIGTKYGVKVTYPYPYPSPSPSRHRCIHIRALPYYSPIVRQPLRFSTALRSVSLSFSLSSLSLSFFLSLPLLSLQNLSAP